MNPIKIALAFLTVLFVVTGVAIAQYKATGKAGDMEVQLTLDRNPPIVGQNIATIAITDSAGNPVMDAAVRLEFGMPAMPGMPAMHYKNDAAPIENENVYKAPMTLSMGGPWYINVRILKDKKVSTAKFNVDVQ